MAIDKLVDSSQLDNNLTLVANAIRAKGGTSASLSFPTEYITAINAISSGNSSGYTRTVIVPEQTVTPVYHSDGNVNGYSAQLNNTTEMFEQWSEYIVTFNGTEYYFTTILMWSNNYLMGEQAYLWRGTSETVYPYPFCVIATSINDNYIYTASTDSVTVKIEKIELTGSGGGGTPAETLLGNTPYTLLEDANIKLVGDGSYTYSYTGTIADFEDRQNVTGTGAILTDEGSYYQLVDNGASAWTQALVQMSFDGLTVGSSYTITVSGAGDGTTSTSGYWVIRDAGGNTSYGTINPLAGVSSLTFEATTTRINVMLGCADSTSWDNGIRTAKFTDMVITGAVEGSGSGEVALGQLTAGTQITSTPSVEVYAIIESSGETLRGKTCVCLGDSVTGLMAPPNDYPSVLASNTGMTVINGGFEGCRMSDTHPSATYAAFSAVKLADAIATGTWTTQDANISGFESGSYAPAHLTALKAVDWSDVDYITVEFGGNDAGDQYVYINNASNPTDTTTYVGAARYVYNRIHTAYPNIKIMFFVPMYRYWISEGKDSDEMTFTLGGNTYHYYDWGDALIASPPASGVPVIDMYRTLGINATNRQTYLLTSDQTHPSVAGCELIAQKFQTELTNHFLPSGGGGSATLITKTITANGTYSASDDNADGYSEVTVNLPVTWETKTDQNITISFDGTYNYSFWTYTEPLQANETYRITWGENGTQYICQTVAESAGGTYDGYFLGNASIVNLGENTGEPFLLYRNSSTRMIVTTTQSTGSWHVKVEKQVQISATLTTKTITENGTYTALNDSADGYSEVVVNVSSGSETTYDNIVPLQTINCAASLSNDAYGGYINPYTSFTEEGEKYRVIFDGTTYEPLTATYYGSGTSYLYVGDPNVQASSSATLAYPFEVMLLNGQTFYLGVKGSGSHTLQVDKITTSGGSTNLLSGKILSTTGDSIVAGAGNNGTGYPEIVASDNSMIVQNIAVGGGTVAYVNANTFCISRSISSMRSDADFVLLEGGGNDADSGVPLGTLSSGYTATLDDTTFAGAIESMFKAALARFPDKKIGYVFIHKCASLFDSRVSNSYYDMAKSACEKWGISYLDLNTQVPPLNYIADLKSTYTANGDGYHPNELGYRTFYVPKITAFMKTMLTDIRTTSKTVTANGTYLAETDNVDGYSSVTVSVTPNLQSKSATPTTSSQTISPDSGYDGLSSVTVGAIPSQYIVPTGSLNITTNNTYDVTNYANAVVNIPSSWTKIAETSYQVNTTGTSATTVATWATGHSEIWTSDKIVYVRVRDTAGKRAGYFYGIDAWVMNRYPKTPSLSSYTSSSELVYQIWRVNSAGEYACRYGYNTTGYGVFPDTIYNNGAIRIRSRYNSSYSLTINGIYKVEVYLLNPPTGAPIFT